MSGFVSTDLPERIYGRADGDKQANFHTSMTSVAVSGYRRKRALVFLSYVVLHASIGLYAREFRG